ncbi:putative DNA-directed RNA polymerase I subunit rpa1-like [Capsicum annuum]|nr:putative DNA-directed RNA polymerase I subunit rpa1-like [Capsicum annuum]
MMNLLVKNENKIKTWGANGISLECMNMFNIWRYIAHRCKVELNRNWGYEVSDGEDRHTVNLEHKTYTCRLWDLLGIPCPDSIKALMHKKVIPQTKIHWWYSKEAYMLTYKHKMQPVRGERFWKAEDSHAMFPSNVVKQVGRPKSKRDREPDEARKRKGE